MDSNAITVPKPSGNISMGSAAEDLKNAYRNAPPDSNPWEFVAQTASRIFATRKLVPNEPDPPVKPA